MESAWIDVKEQPLPTSGQAIVSITRRWGVAEQQAPACFCDVVRCYEIGPVGSDGDSYLYSAEITHWQPLPQPVKAFEYN